MSLEDDCVVSKTVWQARPTQLAVTDRITVRNLQVSVGAGVDVWGRPKKQRALITVTLSLARPFDSAAEADALDNSTVHYGTLSKSVQANINGQTGHVGSGLLAENIVNVARNTAGDTPLSSIEVDIFYPKGSMFGDGAAFSHGQAFPPDQSKYTQLHLRNVRIPCLIGVNANERLQKQPVIVNIWVDRVSTFRVDHYQRLETALVDVISSSSFETLESLSTTVINHLRNSFFTAEIDKISLIRLQIEKPHAVPAADAPVIDIIRPVGT
ncbi:uncharacterized protein N0V89_007464 [Didymosphaeria variabile]|uniref:dihydroneopterin aldolase n=1 Tax=Didymosphaeria variabile TaxID=1932322 RepID=A0A9W9CAA1_9PLEO|nr:uncharacterized protein N0V89_007464 [Didymosphaeria variabile]KAJ4352118.1 hypothetical protein N0V89_007464 [Didymosphaeria variabile]